jgi:hypothetical protein
MKAPDREEAMNMLWQLLCLVSFALAVHQTVALVRERIADAPGRYPSEWSAREYCYVKDLRTFAGLGLIVVWAVLVHSGAHVTQLWQGSERAAPHMVFALLYTLSWLSLARRKDWTQFAGSSPARVIRHPYGQTLWIGVTFCAALAAITAL